jgi:hypothetical protein
MVESIETFDDKHNYLVSELRVVSRAEVDNSRQSLIVIPVLEDSTVKLKVKIGFPLYICIF